MTQQTLLLVDDEISFLNSMVRALRNEPYILMVASNGQDALEILNKFNVDVVVADYRMPVLDGLNLLKLIRVAYPLVTPIMVTAFCDVNIILQAINEIRVYKFLLKPVRLDDFRITIKFAMKESKDGLITPPETQLKELYYDLERNFPGITTVRRDTDGYYLLEE